MKSIVKNPVEPHSVEIDWLAKHRRPWVFERILLVGTELFTRSLKGAFTSNLFTLDTASNCVEAVRKILHSEYEVVVCDVTPKFPADMFYLATERTRPYLVRRLLFIAGSDTEPRIHTFLRKSAAATLWKP